MEADVSPLGCFQIVDSRGQIWAKQIRSAQAAALFAGAQKLAESFAGMLDQLGEHMGAHIWDFGSSGADRRELVEDVGPLEALYPGAPEFARWLDDLEQDFVRAVGTASD